MARDFDDMFDDDLTSNPINYGNAKKAAYGIAALLPFLSAILPIISVIVSIWICVDYLMWYGPQYEIEDVYKEAYNNPEYYQAQLLEEQGFYLVKENGVQKVHYRDYNTGEEFTVSFAQFIQDSKNFYNFLTATDIAADKNTYLMDDSDMLEVLLTIILEEEKRKEFMYVPYKYISREYAWFATDETGAPNLENPLTKEEAQELENMGISCIRGWYPSGYEYTRFKSNPEQFWADTDGEELSRWRQLDADAVKIARNDIEGEKKTANVLDPLDGTYKSVEVPRFQINWQTVFTILSYYSNNMYEGTANKGWGYDDGTKDALYDKPGKDQVNLDDYYMTDATVHKVLDAVSYTFEFYTDIDGKNYSEAEWYQKYKDSAENGGFLWQTYVHSGTESSPKWQKWLARVVTKKADDIMDRIVELYWYCHKSLFIDGNRLTYGELENYSYYLSDENIEIPPDIPEDAVDMATASVEKVPERAPMRISNIFETYVYRYEHPEPSANGITYGEWICTGRDHYVDAVGFYNFMRSLCPDFEWENFIYMLEAFPGSEQQVEDMKHLWEIYERQVETGEEYGEIEHETADMFYPANQVGKAPVRIGKGAGVKQEDLEAGAKPKKGKPGIPNFKPVTDWSQFDGEYIYLNSGSFVGWMRILDDAQVDLTQSDNLSLSEIQNLVDYIWGKSAHPDECDFRDIADDLYTWQNNGGGSITGIFAILWTEQGRDLHSTYVWKYWNFGNYTTNTGEALIPGSSRFVDYSQIYDSPTDSLLSYFNKVSSNYWHRSSGAQNTYYSMCYMLGSGGLYGAQDPSEASAQTAAIAHSYCPYWESNANPTAEPTDGYNYLGWPNVCARNRAELLAYLGK